MTDDRELRHSIILDHERRRTVIEDPRTGAQELILQLRAEINYLRDVILMQMKRIDEVRSQPCARCAERGEA